uniref:Uncharacterized protein n=1 Tax=Sciurus vulgaris TaxID=55149 RepID=A0A8D2DZQ9_SCIVU
MSKRRKPRTSGEGLRPPKPPKNPRLGHCQGGPRSSQSGPLHHPEEFEDGSGPTAFAELSREELGGAIRSSPHEEAGAAPRLLRQPEREPVPLAPSQNSVGRFVPQFAKPRKTGTRRAETREEDPEPGAVSLGFPAGSKSGLCWPDPSPRARGDLVVAEVQQRPGAGGQAHEACRMADATGTVRGLVVELSNLNRLIMSTHRDLEAFKRLTSRKAKPPGKNPLPYPSRGAGNLPRGEQAWRDL